MTMQDADQILGTIRDLLHERFDIPTANATRATSLQELGLDSMMVMDVMLDVEDRLGLKLNDLALPRTPTLGDVVDLIERNLALGA